jgi:DNA-binding CsgD family transcriptional regulator
MLHVCLLDWECRYTYLSSVAPGFSEEDFLGKRPWDLCLPEQVEESKSNFLPVLEDRQTRRWGMLWKPPREGLGAMFYYSVLKFAGLHDTALVLHTWGFDHNLDRLSPKETDVLDRLGEGCGPGLIAHELGLTTSTVHTHLRRAREKLDLSDLAELTAFAGVYRTVVRLA